ncbi:uncharacterized protein VP01_5510g1 [Puccinia sorghi]|uniref:Uncharacterized protein n=1 Tax=Puccinia sorghi TaxID=27349 RepID=A0A0L6UJC1_9BASI|nr:uncharacterized protein VP01_5510g1 [Puccinia sorghi]
MTLGSVGSVLRNGNFTQFYFRACKYAQEGDCHAANPTYWMGFAKRVPPPASGLIDIAFLERAADQATQNNTANNPISPLALPSTNSVAQDYSKGAMSEEDDRRSSKQSRQLNAVFPSQWCLCCCKGRRVAIKEANTRNCFLQTDQARLIFQRNKSVMKELSAAFAGGEVSFAEQTESV